MVDIPKDRWIIIENTHEPIIDREVFNEIQEILENCKYFFQFFCTFGTVHKTAGQFTALVW